MRRIIIYIIITVAAGLIAGGVQIYMDSKEEPDCSDYVTGAKDFRCKTYRPEGPMSY